MNNNPSYAEKIPYFPILNWAATLVSASLVIGAYLLEYAVGLTPCPLCVIQRYVFLLTTVFWFLSAALMSRHFLYRGLLMVNSFLLTLGGLISARHLWLIHYPSQEIPSCGASLEYLMTHLPFSDVFKLLFKGLGGCHEANWTFIGLNLPTWAFFFYLILLAMNLFSLYSLKKSTASLI